MTAQETGLVEPYFKHLCHLQLVLFMIKVHLQIKIKEGRAVAFVLLRLNSPVGSDVAFVSLEHCVLHFHSSAFSDTLSLIFSLNVVFFFSKE